MNRALNQGGGIAIRDTDTQIQISASFIGNRAKSGGAALIERGRKVTLNSAILDGNFRSSVYLIDSNVTFSGATVITNNIGGGDLFHKL